MNIEELKVEAARHPDEAVVSENALVTWGVVRELLFKLDLYEQINYGLGQRLLAGREDRLVPCPGVAPCTG